MTASASLNPESAHWGGAGPPVTLSSPAAFGVRTVTGSFKVKQVVSVANPEGSLKAFTLAGVGEGESQKGPSCFLLQTMTGMCFAFLAKTGDASAAHDLLLSCTFLT